MQFGALCGLFFSQFGFRKAVITPFVNYLVRTVTGTGLVARRVTLWNTPRILGVT